VMCLESASVVGKHRAASTIHGLLQALKKGPVAGRHIFAHLLQIDGQGIGRMSDAETGIETGHNGALCPRLAAKRLRLTGVSRYAAVQQSLCQSGTVFPPVNIGADTRVVDI